MGMAAGVNILNTHVAAYFEKIREGKLTMHFHPGNDFVLEGWVNNTRRRGCALSQHDG